MIKYSYSGLLVTLGSLFIPLGAFASEAAPVSTPFLYNFNQDGVLEESWPADESSSPYFWLNSGGKLIIENGIGKTIQGGLSEGDPWRIAYAKSSSADTEGGFYPENLFRLNTRSTWNNVSQELSFRIDKTNLVDTAQRDAFSGIFFISRYKDNNNLYYAGLRMDGMAVVKKKVGGTYYTLATSEVFGSKDSYDKYLNPNLLPENQWMRMKSDTKNLPSGEVMITVSIDQNMDNNWVTVLEAVDKPGRFGKTGVLNGPAHAGIRGDFMDLSFEDYRLTEL